LPLEGVRIADFSQVWAGPSATLALALLGADVVKVESSKRIDTTRRLPPFADNVSGPNRAGYFNQYNQQKRSITLNIKDPEGLSVAKDLVKVSDVVIDNFAAGVMNRLGLGYDDLRAIRKDIIAISLSGYGATGPKANFIAYGPVQVPMMGMAYLSGYPDSGPSEIGLSYGDPNAGLNAAIAILSSLEHRERTGEGQQIDMSQWEAAIGLTAEAFMSFALTGAQPERQGNRDPVESPQGVFPSASEDEWVAIACWGDDQWRYLCATIDRPDLAVDERYDTAAKRKQHEEFIEAAIATWTRTLPAEAAAEMLQKLGVAAHKVLSNRDLASNEQLTAFGAFSELEHLEVGRKRHIGTPWRFSHSPVRVTRPAPTLGEHTDEVLSELLGYSEQRIRELRTAEILS
jgi:benzylsuccinate CoA-transferase BbsF subunit